MTNGRLTALGSLLYRKGAPLVVLLAACGHAFAQESWLGVYFGEAKIGYSHVKISSVTRGGRRLYRVYSVTVTRMALLGQPVEQRMVMTQWLDRRWAPRLVDFSMDSGGHRTELRAIFTQKYVKCQFSSGGTTTQKLIPIPKGANLILDPSMMLARAVKPGKKLRFHYLNTVSVAIEPGVAEVLRREAVTVGGVTYNALVVKTTMPMGTIIHWQDDRGELLRAEAMMGITMVKETREQALSLPDTKYAPPADIAAAIAVKSDTPIEEPRKVRMLKLRMASPEEIPLVADGRQSFAPVQSQNGLKAVELTISARDLDAQKALKLQAIPRREFKDYLAPGPYIQSRDPRIVRLAREVVGSEDNALLAAVRLRDWVYSNMKVQSNIGVLRSAVDVLNHRAGVCRDYAILYAALARAVGIPTRLAAGLLYVNGAFYYHAWAESYVGWWVDVDPTLPTAFVDATHVKLVRGDVSSIVSASRVMGNLKAEVLEYK